MSTEGALAAGLAGTGSPEHATEAANAADATNSAEPRSFEWTVMSLAFWSAGSAHKPGRCMCEAHAR